MKAIHIHKHLDSETVTLPELKPLIGKDVEIIVIEERLGEKRPPLRVTPYPAGAGVNGETFRRESLYGDDGR